MSDEQNIGSSSGDSNRGESGSSSRDDSSRDDSSRGESSSGESGDSIRGNSSSGDSSRGDLSSSDSSRGDSSSSDSSRGNSSSSDSSRGDSSSSDSSRGDSSSSDSSRGDSSRGDSSRGDSSSSDSSSSDSSSSDSSRGDSSSSDSSKGDSSRGNSSRGDDLQPKRREIVASLPALHKVPSEMVASVSHTMPALLVIKSAPLPKRFRRLLSSGSVGTSGSSENDEGNNNHKLAKYFLFSFNVATKHNQPLEEPKDPATITDEREDMKPGEEKAETVEHRDNEPYTDPAEIHLPPVPVHTDNNNMIEQQNSDSGTPSFSYEIGEEEGGYANIHVHTNQDIDYEKEYDIV